MALFFMGDISEIQFWIGYLSFFLNQIILNYVE